MNKNTAATTSTTIRWNRIVVLCLFLLYHDVIYFNNHSTTTRKTSTSITTVVYAFIPKTITTNRRLVVRRRPIRQSKQSPNREGIIMMLGNSQEQRLQHYSSSLSRRRFESSSPQHAQDSSPANHHHKKIHSITTKYSLSSSSSSSTQQFMFKTDSKNTITTSTENESSSSLLSPLSSGSSVGGGNSMTLNTGTLISIASGIFVSATIMIVSSLGYDVNDVIHTLQNVIKDPQGSLQTLIDGIANLGPAGPFYFGCLYCIAEIFAIPATPFTLSAGYLFGIRDGVCVVIFAGAIAACIGYIIGKTVLRTNVENMVLENPKLAKLDKAIGQEGFKLLLLIRLSPIFPFSIVNYIYGASSMEFIPYIVGTMIGFIPNTLAYVYTGMIGKAITTTTTTIGSSNSSFDGQPWYIYAGGFAVLITFLKLITDVASGIIDSIDDDDE